MSKAIWLTISLPLIFLSTANSKSWNYRENPILKVSKTLNINLDSLPQSGEVSKFMGDNWIWPLKEGFISNRWSLQNPKKNSEKYKYKLLKTTGLDNIDIGQLSPAEKFDLFSKNTDWNFTISLKNYLKKSKNLGLYLELSFAETSLNYPDQTPLTVKNDSQIINFGSSDLKALITANYFLNYAKKARFLGEICLKNFSKIKQSSDGDISSIIDSSRCHGLNPGTFHIMISNFLGIKDQGISLDLKRDKTLKIRPIIGFISKIKKFTSQKNLVEVTTYLKYLRPSRPTWINEVAGVRGYTILKYNLELDKKGNITGGQWISANRPDFLVIPKRLRLKGIFTKIAGNIKNVPNYKNKALTQKLIIKDLLNRISKKEKISNVTLNKFIIEYANTSKEYYKQKKALKRQLRKINTREIDTERDILLKRLSKHKMQGKLRSIHEAIIDTAMMNTGNIFKKFLLIRSMHRKFIHKARSSNEENDLKTLGKVAFIQKKLINNYFKKSIDKKVDIDSLYLNYLMEASIYKRRSILTKSEDFLTHSKDFLEGLKSESDFFKLNRKGRVFPKKGELLGAKIKELEKDKQSAFKKLVLKNKVSKSKAWKSFLTSPPSRTIASARDIAPKDELEKYLTLSLDQKKLKNVYITSLLKISIALKKEKKGKKIITQAQLNNKLRADIQEEIAIVKRNYDLDLYLLNSYREKLDQKGNKLFQDQKLEDIKLSLFNEYQQILTKKTGVNQKFLDSIRTGNLKQFKKLQQLTPSLTYKSIEGENAIMTAVKFGQVVMLKKLIKNNQHQINSETANGQNALFLAVINENKIQEVIRFEIIKSLIKAGIKKNTKDRFGKTPRDYVADSGSMEGKLEVLLK